MLCEKCNADIPDISIYCMLCGKKLVKTERKNQNLAETGRGQSTILKVNRFGRQLTQPAEIKTEKPFAGRYTAKPEKR